MVLLSITSFLGASGAAWMGTYLPLSILAIFVTVIFHGALVMFGRAFNIRELESFAISEIMQAAATAFMAIFLIVMVTSAMEIAKGYIHGTLDCGGKPWNIGVNTHLTDQQTLIDDAYDAIRCTLQVRAQTVAAIQEDMYGSAESWAEFNALNIGLSIFGITFFKGEWIGSLYETTETKRLTNNLATVMLIGLNGQSALMLYLKSNMLHIFLPVGILLRSFYFTRGPGALFMALGIGMYFLFPIFYLLLDPGFKPAPPDPPAPPQTGHPYCYTTMSSAISMVTTMQEGGMGTSSGLGMSGDREQLAKSYVSMMLHPLVALFLTLVFVRYMMSVLGGDSSDLMKMVSKVI